MESLRPSPGPAAALSRAPARVVPVTWPNATPDALARTWRYMKW
ncbi:hypothetical protein Rrhod_3972 [Rhodococcus rhodnii LMG 5362]|uniref:Uncharacterized protein n=1 Tax=Rhodococcus rhodnii LMG 5362 TaxID=1273125 RepID=R7WHP6_9NOCA|nr:hypothetical protein Rrhod_3972 [Rhodococcus rhodnii LMG 5362]